MTRQDHQQRESRMAKRANQAPGKMPARPRLIQSDWYAVGKAERAANAARRERGLEEIRP